MDRDVVIFLNGFLVKNHLLGRTDLTFNALIPVTIITGLWFSNRCKASRGRLLVGVCAALAATALSRAIQMSFAIHQRPALTVPLILPSDFSFFSRLSSFPSDHATLVFALSAVILFSNKWLGLLSFALMTVICAHRVALGLHYPSDVLAGLILGIAAVALSRWIRCPKWIWSFEEFNSGIFYGLMMIGAYETITYFSDVLAVLKVFN